MGLHRPIRLQGLISLHGPDYGPLATTCSNNGFANPFILEDPDLNSLRGDAEFDRLVAKTTAGQ